jgi:hypothetical protein
VRVLSIRPHATCSNGGGKRTKTALSRAVTWCRHTCVTGTRVFIWEITASSRVGAPTRRACTHVIVICPNIDNDLDPDQFPESGPHFCVYPDRYLESWVWRLF